MLVNVVSAVLHGDHATASAALYHTDGFTAVAAKGEQERIEFLIIGLDGADDVLLPNFCLC